MVQGEVTPQGQFVERIEEQIIEVPTLHGIPQEPISERIVEQIVEVPKLHDIPRKPTSKRIVEQNVEVPQAARYSSEANFEANCGAERR